MSYDLKRIGAFLGWISKDVTKECGPELAASEKEELLIIERILPAQMPREEIEKIARAKAAELGISDKTGSGKLMSALMKDLKGKADGAVVKEIVDSLFV